MKNSIIVYVLLFPVLFFSCEKNNDVIRSNNLVLNKTTEELIRSDNEFGIDLFKRVTGSYPDEDNMVISPLSAALALAMTYNGAGGTTRDAMETALKKTGMTKEEINGCYKNLMNGLMALDPQVTLDIANSIWYREGFPVSEDFKAINRDYYTAEVNSLDFNDPSAKNVMNNWVSDNTNGKITDIIENVPAAAVMYLINAVYFYGTWKYEFSESDTRPAAFYPESGDPFNVDMMAQKVVTDYTSNELFSAVKLPYGNDHYSMAILLPGYGKTTTDIIDELSPENWDQWLGSFVSNDSVNLRLPKFRFAFEDSLNNELKAMGMEIAFSPLEADFTGMIDENQYVDGNLFISMVKQKAFIDVNEKGTEAAAATVVEISLSSSGQEHEIYFTADHPFLFVIMENQSGSILFIGKVGRPEYKDV